MFVVMGSNRWGKGETLETAKRNFRNQGAKLSNGYGIFEFGTGSTFAGIDQMGRVHYHGNAPDFREIGRKGVTR